MTTDKKAIKYDSDKRQWDLLPMDAVEEIVKVLEFGANKYAPNNWKEHGGFKWVRVLNSLRRHLYAFIRGEDNDPETGISHLAHAGCNVLFLLHYTLNREKFSQNDNRDTNE